MYPLLQGPLAVVMPAVLQQNPPGQGLQSSWIRRPELFDQVPTGQGKGAVMPEKMMQNQLTHQLKTIQIQIFGLFKSFAIYLFIYICFGAK